MNDTDHDSEHIVVIHDGFAYVFADEASLELWSLYDSPTYQQVTRATDEEQQAAAVEWLNSASSSSGPR